jgi:predicted ferric reductase
MTVIASTLGPSAYWYLTRATGSVTLVLLTLSLVLGVLDVARISSRRWPRFVVDGVHRGASLLAVAFLVVHVLTSLLDSFAPIGLADALIPFGGHYRPLWLGFGAVALDLLLAVAISSLIRDRLGYTAWRVLHWLAYGCWPVAFLHALGTGTDTRASWSLILDGLCLAAVVVAAGSRLFQAPRSASQLRAIGFAGMAVFAIGVVAWLPSGPLAHGWARRAGTPRSLLAPSAPARRSSR